MRTPSHQMSRVAAIGLACTAGLATTAMAQYAPLPAQSIGRDDAIFGLSNTNALRSTKQVKANFSVKDSGNVTATQWARPFIQSVEFDNLSGLRHNSQGNLLGLNFGSLNTTTGVLTPGTLSIMATRNITTGQTTPAASALLYTFDGTNGSEAGRVGGLSISPTNTRIGLTTTDNTGKVIIMDYTAAAGDAVGASVSNYRSIAIPGIAGKTVATTWLNSNSLLVAGAGATSGSQGDLYRVDVGAGGALTTTSIASNLFNGIALTFTNVTYEPTVSPYIIVSGSGFIGGATTNALIALDASTLAPVTPLINLSPSGTAGTPDGQINTLREVAFDSKGNLVMGAFQGSTALSNEYGIKSLVGGANATTIVDNDPRLVGILRKDQTSDATTGTAPNVINGTSSSFNGLDVAMTNVDYANADVQVNIGTADITQTYVGASPLSKVVAKLAAGTIVGATSPTGNTAVGYVVTPGTGGGTVRFLYTLLGDATLDKAVGFSDLLIVAQSYDPAGSGKVWTDGDFDYNGIVNFNDLLALAQNYGGSLLTAGDLINAGLSPEFAMNFAADFALAQSLVPEPTTLALVGLAAVALRRNRRVG